MLFRKLRRHDDFLRGHRLFTQLHFLLRLSFHRGIRTRMGLHDADDHCHGVDWPGSKSPDGRARVRILHFGFPVAWRIVIFHQWLETLRVDQLCSYVNFHRILVDYAGNTQYKHTVFAEINAHPEISAHQKQWFFKGGSTQNRWVLMDDFSKGGVHKTDGFWNVFYCF